MDRDFALVHRFPQFVGWLAWVSHEITALVQFFHYSIACSVFHTRIFVTPERGGEDFVTDRCTALIPP